MRRFYPIFGMTGKKTDGGQVFIDMIYEIADLRIRINNKYRYTTEFCREYISPDQQAPFDISAEANDDEMAREKELSPDFPDAYIENICLYRIICNQLPGFDRFLLHGAILDYHGGGYAFLGRSGIGKSTHTSLWLEYIPETRIINGDKPILYVKGDTVFAYGTPWMGKEHRGENSRTVLKAICFLAQARENSIEKLSHSQVVDRIFNQILLPDDENNAAKTLELIDKTVTLLPAYLLKCDISEDAVKLAFKTMAQK